MSSLDDAHQLFADQHGVAADRQLRPIGIDKDRQRRLLNSGHWRRHSPGVVAACGSPVTWHQRAMAATLSSGGLCLLSGRPSGRLHAIDGHVDDEDVEVVIPHGANYRRQDGVRVRRSRRLSIKDRHVIDGIPVTIAPVTLIHLAADGENVERALDSVLRQRAHPLWLRQNFERWRGDGVVGPSQLLALLEARMGKRLPRSWFQRLAKRALAEHGITLEDELPVFDERGRLVAELDLADPLLKVGVECQSLAFHASATAVRKDSQRRRKLALLGWRIIELWWTDLHNLDGVLAELTAAADQSRRLAGTTPIPGS